MRGIKNKEPARMPVIERHRVIVKLNTKDRNFLEQHVRENGGSMSAFIRELVEERLKQIMEIKNDCKMSEMQ